MAKATVQKKEAPVYKDIQDTISERAKEDLAMMVRMIAPPLVKMLLIPPKTWIQFFNASGDWKSEVFFTPVGWQRVEIPSSWHVKVSSVEFK